VDTFFCFGFSCSRCLDPVRAGIVNSFFALVTKGFSFIDFTDKTSLLPFFSVSLEGLPGYSGMVELS